ncbi:HAD family hydrolase [Treponema socranskii]|uniref:HAD family hydrolase n=1 Tax=Treponema socranskii TaxID=53419 RepID=UPI003D935DC0
MKNIKIIWDLDGTLIKSEEEVLSSLVDSVREVGLTELDQIAPFQVGPTVDKILEASFSSGILTENLKSEIIRRFRNIYDNCGFEKTKPYLGVEDVLNISEVRNYIVTNKPDLATNRIIHKLGWDGLFKKILTPYSNISKCNRKKSKSELFSEILLNKDNDSLYFGIGDMSADAKAAIDNKIIPIGVLWGTGTQEELLEAHCEYIFDTVENLRKFIIKQMKC